ncbi:hypothetical protein [Nitritalea halalkaliphila]|uniref:hypothetical protein n=1 Tax=Nitritalea halalkaliphila TaxID=590849 RepID=UPI00031848FB|nr:hypothetical protein [Nitritalea halalkaliphila]
MIVIVLSALNAGLIDIYQAVAMVIGQVSAPAAPWCSAPLAVAQIKNVCPMAT